MLNKHKVLKVITVVGALAFYIPMLYKAILYLIFVVAFPICGNTVEHIVNSPSGEHEMTVIYSDCGASSIDTIISIKGKSTNRDYGNLARFKGELPATNFTWKDNSVVIKDFELQNLIYLRRYNEFRVDLRPN